MYEKVSPNLNFVDREKQTVKFWKDNDIFKKSMEPVFLNVNSYFQIFYIYRCCHRELLTDFWQLLTNTEQHKTRRHPSGYCLSFM